MAQELISQSEFARRLGVSRQYVNKLIRLGKIEKFGTQVDFEAASLAIKQVSDPAHAKIADPAPDPDSSAPSGPRAPTFGEAKTMKEIYTAKLARLRFEEESGKLIDRGEMEDRARDIAVILKEGLLALPAKLMESLSLLDDPREINALLDREFREVLRQMSGQMRK